MKKFVFSFLLMILTTPSYATLIETITAETIIPEVVLVETHPLDVVRVDLNVVTFAVDLSAPDVIISALPDEAEIRCIQQNVFYEARGQGYRGMKAVANVTIHRMNHSSYPSTACGVVKQRRGAVCQFSWVCDKSKSRPEPGHREYAIWAQAREIAESALQGTLQDVVNGATHFHNTRVRPSWSSRLRFTVQIGGHLFYR